GASCCTTPKPERDGRRWSGTQAPSCAWDSRRMASGWRPVALTATSGCGRGGSCDKGEEDKNRGHRFRAPARPADGRRIRWYAGEAMQGDHDPYAALRYRDYRHLLAGSILASIGTEAQAVAVGWELYRRTNSAWALGI